MMRVEVFKESRDKWNAYVLGNPEGSIYHLYEWGTFFEDFYGFKTLKLAVYDGDDIRAIAELVVMKNYTMKSIVVSLPYFCVGGILSDSPQAEQIISEKIQELTVVHKYGYTLLRNNHVHDEMAYDYVDKRKATFILSLNSDYENVFNGFERQIRRRIRKGYKSGCEIDISKDYLDDFYDIYRTNMRRLGSPVHKRSFYSEILDRFPDKYTILVVRLNNKVIGAQLLSYFKKTVYLPLASSLEEYNEYSPNHLLYWESIKYGCENGYETCDFGRSTVDSGPYVFKKQWNATEHPLHYCYYYSKKETKSDNRGSYDKLDLIREAWKRMPLSVTNVVGPALAKWFP